jgi:hypothetical protein
LDLRIRRDLQASYDDLGHSLLLTSSVKTLEDENLTVWLADLAKVVQFFGTTASFQMLLRSTIEQHGNKLRLVFQHDEITPGNPLRPVADNPRKGTVVLASFLEFGQALRREEAWLPMAVARSQDTAVVKGKLSAVLRSILLRLVRTGVFDNGFVVDLGAERVHVDVVIRALSADESALKQTWDVIGASGHRCCSLKCLNAVTEKSKIADADPFFVSIADDDFSKFIPMDDASFYKTCDSLEELASEVGSNMGKIQTAAGMNHVPTGLASDKTLRRYIQPSMSHYDGMHNLLSNGVGNAELSFFVSACILKMPDRDVVAELRTMLASSWNYPHAKKNASVCTASARLGAFTDAKIDAGGSYRGNASQLLTVLPIVAFWAIMVAVPDNRAARETDSFLAMCEVITEYVKLKRQSPPLDASKFRKAVSAHKPKFKLAYGAEYVRPKHHYTEHMGDQAEELDFVLDCQSQERKGDVYKHNVAEHMQSNLQRFSFSCLSQLLVVQLHMLESLPANTFSSRLLHACCQADFGSVSGLCS